MEMLSGSQIDSFLSATSLMWVSSIVLIMVGLVYYIKYKERHDSIKNSQFFILYLLTIILNILVYVMNIIMRTNPPYETIIYKAYILTKFFWNISIMFYVINYINVNNKLNIKRSRIIKLIFMIIATICCVILDIDVALESNGKFYILVGVLNSTYNICAIISHSILLLIVLIFRKKTPKGFCTLSVLTFSIYIGILIFKNTTGYIVNESVFIYSILVLIIFNTTSNQDKVIVNQLTIQKDALLEINSKRDKLINKTLCNLGQSLNDLVLYNDELFLSKENAREIIQSDNKLVDNKISELEDYLNNIKDVFLLETINNNVNCEFDLNTLINSINSKIMDLPNTKDINFNIVVGENTFLNYIGNLKILELIITNTINSIINSPNEHKDILLTITSKLNEFNKIELNIMIKSSGKIISNNLSELKINDYIDNDEKINKEDFKIIIVNELLKKLNSKINIKTDDSNTIIYFTIMENFKDSELFNNIKEV